MDALQLSASFEHAQALANAKELAAAIREIRDASRDMGDAGGTAGRKVDDLGDSARKTSGSVQAAASSFQQFNTQLNVTNEQSSTFNSNSSTVVNNITKISNSTREAGDETGKMSGLVGQWIGAYAGVNGVIRLIDTMLERMQKMIDMETKLGDLAYDDDKMLASVATRMGASGEAGLSHVRKIRDQIVAESGVTGQKAAEAMTAAMVGRFNLGSASGAGVASELAKFGQRQELDQGNLTRFIRGARDQGATELGSVKRIIAKDEASIKAAGVSAKEFYNAEDRLLTEAGNAGIDQDMAVSLYATMAGSGKGDPRRAGTATEAILRLASAKGSKAEIYMAHRAAQLGVTKVGAVSDADVEKILSGTKEGQSVSREREEIARIEGEAEHEEATERQRIRSAGRRGGTGEEQLQHERRMQNFQERIANLRESSGRTFEAARKKELSRREVEQYGSVGAQDRLERVVFPTVMGIGSVKDRTEFESGSGETQGGQDALFYLRDKEFSKTFRSTLAQRRSATAADADAASDSYASRDFYDRDAAINLSKVNQASMAKQNGMDYVASLAARAKLRYENGEGKGKYVPELSPDIFTNFEKVISSDARNEAAEAFGVIQDDMAEFIQNPASSPGERRAAQRLLHKLQADLHAEDPRNLSGKSIQREINNIGGAFGTLKRTAKLRLEADTGSSGGDFDTGSSGGDFGTPSTHPTTMPSGAVSYNVTNHHVHIGNHWSGGFDDDDFEAPGRLEGFA